MANVRNNRYSLREHLKASSHPRDQHPQFRRADAEADDTIDLLQSDDTEAENPQEFETEE